MGWLQSEVEDAIKNVLTDIKDALLGLITDLIRALLHPIVGVPTPRSDSRYIVVGAPDNEPWQSVYQDFYIQYVLPLTIMLLIVGLAYIGLRSGSISEYRQRRLVRRIGLVFMGTFVWFPLVSIPLQFVDALGMTIAPAGDMAGGIRGLFDTALGGVFVTLAIVIVSNTLLLLAAFVYALRWLGIYMLTPMMPLLGVCWALEIWPFNVASNIARRAAGIYPGLVLAGLPAAILFRLGWELEISTSLSGLFALFVGLALIPAACLASILTVYWSSPAMRTIAQQGTKRANPAAAATTTKASTGKAVRGARNVHRGLSEKPHGPVTKTGQTQLGSGSSKAYALGSSARSAKNTAEKYNNLRKSSTGQMRDKAKQDASTVKERTKAQSKRAFKNTKEKVSRW